MVFDLRALMVVYALLDEYHQSFVPSRTPRFSTADRHAGGLTP
jgi:VanZ family protein